jgi:type IV secretory pathway component VirB8
MQNNKEAFLYQNTLKQSFFWMRATFFSLFAISVLVVALAFSFYQITRKETDIQYIEYCQNNQSSFFKKLKLTSELNQADLLDLAEKELRWYIKTRLSIAGVEKTGNIDEEKITVLSLMSNKKVAREFRRDYSELLEKAGFSKRDVEIKYLTRRGDLNKHSYNAVVELVDYYEDGEIDISKYAVEIIFKIQTSSRKDDQMLKYNPLGFKVEYFRQDKEVTKQIREINDLQY